MNNKIAVIIKTSNSENTLCKTLESVKDLGEIIIIDEHSTDDTIEIAKSYKAKIIYAEKNNISLAFKQAKNETESEWILILEDSQAINKALSNEIKKVIYENPKSKTIAYLINQRNFYFNKELKTTNKKVLKLFKKENIDFEGEYFLKINLKKERRTKVCKIKCKDGAIFNYFENNIEKELTKTLERNHITIKNMEKTKKPSLFIKPIFEFIYWYFIKKACFDGKIGYIYSAKKMIEKFIFEIAKLEKRIKDNDF